ncbi:MAG TPA: ABC transporter ATP-binding protein [Opitutales bacterium]|jgi:ABC-2 type transport system ATP-binding protein|nr:ABC transporter ATP-binding protein [Opitutales bacterium]
MNAAPTAAPPAPGAPNGATGLAVDVKGLTKHYGPRAVVDHIDFEVRRGEVYGFLGPNGSGKTTFMRMLCGLLTPDDGEGTCLGYNLRTQSDRIRLEVGYMTQKFSYYEDMSIEENLDFVARIYALPDRRTAVAASLEQLGLTARRKQLAGTLSGGWKQRLALAACMIHRPKLLLLDEPTAGVDPKARRDFWEQIHELAAEGLSVLIATHYMDEAERCHRVAYLSYGKLLTHGTVEEVVAGAGLTVWRVESSNPSELVVALHGWPKVSVVPFGSALHICGADAEAVRMAVEAVEGPGVTATPSKPSLEDVFIHLQGSAQDNFN